jgi:hypothetical protein
MMPPFFPGGSALSHRFIIDFREGDSLKQFFLLRRVESRRTKDGKPYLDLVLADQSGTIKGKPCSNAPAPWWNAISSRSPAK